MRKLILPEPIARNLKTCVGCGKPKNETHGLPMACCWHCFKDAPVPLKYANLSFEDWQRALPDDRAITAQLKRDLVSRFQAGSKVIYNERGHTDIPGEVIEANPDGMIVQWEDRASSTYIQFPGDSDELSGWMRSITVPSITVPSSIRIKVRYALMNEQGRFYSRYGTTATWVEPPSLAYTWEIEATARAMRVCVAPSPSSQVNVVELTTTYANDKDLFGNTEIRIL